MTSAQLNNNESTTAAALLNYDEEQQLLIVGAEYINQEIENLRKEQEDLDERGNYLEKQIRRIMSKQVQQQQQKSSSNSKEMKQAEDNLLKEWFLLINRKNALLHRQQELEIL